MFTFSREGRPTCFVIAVAALVVCVALPATVSAQETKPPTIDRFADRQPVGEQGLAVLYERVSGQARVPGDLRVFDLEPSFDERDRPNGVTGAARLSMPAVTSNSLQSMVAADLGTRKDERLGGDGREGLIVAATGQYRGTDCQRGDICVVYLAPQYVGGKVSRLKTLSVRLQPDVGPVGGTAVSAVAGQFSNADGPSLLIAWIGQRRSGPKRVWVQHVGADRERNGDVRELKALGKPVDVSGTTNIQSQNVTLVAGDFAGNGQEYAAILGYAGTYRFNAGIAAGFVRGTASGVEQVVEVGPIDAPPGQLSSLDEVTAPVGIAVRDEPRPLDIRVPGRDRLVLQARHLFDPSVVEWNGKPGRASAIQITGNRGLDSSATEKPAVNVGDTDLDGAEEVATFDGSTVHLWADDRTRAGFALNRRSYGDVGRALRPGRVAEVELVAADTRPVDKQAIAADPSAPDRNATQLYFVARYEQPAGSGQPSDARELNRIVGVRLERIAGGQVWTLEPFGRLDIADSPSARGLRVVPLALSGYAELGQPTLTQVKRLDPLVVLNAPPTHFDVLDGQPFDLNFCWAGEQYKVPDPCDFYSEYVRSATQSGTVSSTTTEDWAVSAKRTTGVEIKSIVTLDAELRGGYGESFEKVDRTTTTETVDTTVIARNSDQVYAAERSYDLLEYPLYQPGAETASEFVIAATPHTISRRWINVHTSSAEALDYKHTHQVGNLLSYPSDVTRRGNPFVFGTIFAEDEFEVSPASRFEYALTRSRMQEKSVSQKHTWNVGATLSGGADVLFVHGETELSADYSQSHLRTATTTFGDDTRLATKLGNVNGELGEIGYTAKPFFYYSHDGALVLDYAADPHVASDGAPATWWQRHYGHAPDLTLNLPRLRDRESAAGITSDAARFVSPSVQVLQPGSDKTCRAAEKLDPNYARPGQLLCLRAQVHNYSLHRTATPATRVRFYDGDPDVGGRPIGEAARLGGIGPRSSSTTPVISWRPEARHGRSTIRVFAKVDAERDVREIHEDNNKGFRLARVHAGQSASPTVRAPTDVKASRRGNDGALEVSWQGPDGSPAQLEGFRWRVVAYGENGESVEKVVGGGERSTTVTDLPPGRYRVGIFAVSADGRQQSPVSHPAEPVDVLNATPRQVPSPPRDARASARDGGAVVSWTEPEHDGGAPIGAYVVTAQPGGATERVPAGNREAHIAGLQNGTAYTFTVAAENEIGRGSESAPSSAITPQPKPAAPRIVKVAVVGPGRVTVEWHPPTAGLGSVGIDRYEVCVVEGPCLVVDGRNTTATFERLHSARPVSFVVTAINVLGVRSQPSDPSALVLANVGSSLPIRLPRVTISDFRVSPKQVGLPRNANLRSPRGHFAFSLSHEARVTIAVERRVAGRRTGRRCVPPRRGLKRKCSRYQRRGVLVHAGQVGTNSVPLRARIGSRTLAPGAYRATITATNTSGASVPAKTNFRIVRAKRQR